MSTTIVLAVKYYEEICLFNNQGERFFFDHDFQKAVKIPKAYLIDLQLTFLKSIDHHLFIQGDEYEAYVSRIVRTLEVMRQSQRLSLSQPPPPVDRNP
jgi:hypothetical protein